MSRKQWLIVTGLGGIFGTTFGILQFWKYAHFGYNGLDLGIYAQAVWSLAHGHGFASSIHDPSYLGDHLEFWLIPISWLYRLWSSPLLLLWLQTLLIVSSIIPLAKIANRLASSRVALITAALFLINPLIYNSALYEFHGLVVVLPTALWAIWFYLEQRYWRWLAMALIILVTREDMPLLVAGLGVMALIDRRTWRWWLPPLLMAAMWFPVAQQVIRQANHDGLYKYLAFYQSMGTTAGQILTYPVHHPILFFQRIISFNNVGTIAGLLVTFGFLPLLRPRRLWPLIFITAQLLIGSNPPSSFLSIHYTLPFIPFLLWASLESWQAFSKKNIWPRLDRTGFGIIIPIIAILSPIYSSFILGPAEISWTRSATETHTPTVVLRRAVQDVRPSDRVLTTFDFLPQLANRTSLYSLNYVYLGRRQYSEIPYVMPTAIDVALIDWQQLYEYQYLYKTTVFQHQSGLDRINTVLSDQHLGVVARYGTITVYRRSGEPDTSAAQAVVPTKINKKTFGTVALLNHPLVSLGNSASSDWKEINIDTLWQATEPHQDKLLSVRYDITIDGKKLPDQPRIIGQGPQPSSEWGAGETWQTRDILVLPKNTRGLVTIRATVNIPKGKYRLDRLQAFRPMLTGGKIFGTYDAGSIRL